MSFICDALARYSRRSCCRLRTSINASAADRSMSGAALALALADPPEGGRAALLEVGGADEGAFTVAATVDGGVAGRTSTRNDRIDVRVRGLRRASRARSRSTSKWLTS